MMPSIDVRFHFDEVTEADGYVYYDLRSVQRLGTSIPESAMLSIGEVLGQSDRWNVGGVGATLGAMVDGDEAEHNLKDYL